MLEKTKEKLVKLQEYGENQTLLQSKESILKLKESVIFVFISESPEGATVAKRRSYPIHVSNAGLYDSQAKKAVKVRYGFHPETGEKMRIS